MFLCFIYIYGKSFYTSPDDWREAVPYNYDQFITEYLKEKENSITDDNLRPVFSLFQEKLLFLLDRMKLLYLLNGEEHCSEKTFNENMTLWFLHHQDRSFNSYQNGLICKRGMLTKEKKKIFKAFNVLSALLYDMNGFYRKKFPDVAAGSIEGTCSEVCAWATGILIRWKELSAEERNKYEISESTKAPSKKQVTWWDQQEKPETTEEAKAAP